ncbi:MAG: TonB-dependent receptor [Ignavibacteriaceae bacterium]|nr:TonB-dependent receptor [Ignavibacteriaceae bacterium]
MNYKLNNVLSFLKMKLKSFNLLLTLILLSHASLFGQGKGSIAGKITDRNNNEALIGTNVLIVGTTFGASTDIDGNFIIKNLESGSYSIKISYISYKTTVIENVMVKTGETTKIDVSLEPATTELDEVVITAEALKNTEYNVLKIQKNSSSIVDGISGEMIKKNNASDGSDVLKRMTGVTISEGKYAFIRGVGDRYNNTMLNGASLPSTDPEKKSFSYDIFPASLVENVITAKTFTPDKPADFSGGLVQINTIEFPNKFTLDLSLNSGYNSNITTKNFHSYNGGSSDFLGVDDGTRNIPDIIGSTRLSRGTYSDQELANIAASFGNNWNITSFKAPANSSFKLTIGDKFDFSNEDVLGFVASVNYSSSSDFIEKQKNFYDYTGERYSYNGTNYLQSIMLGGLINVSFKFNSTNKISFKNVFNQNSDDETLQYLGNYRYAGQYREITSLRFVSRSIRSHQLIGENFFNVLNGLNMNWGLSYSRSDRSEPDGRRYIYAKSLDTPEENLRFLLDQSISTRFYSELEDNDYSLNTNFTIKPFENPSSPKFSFGILANRKARVFDARMFGFRNGARGDFFAEDSILQLSVDKIFQPENINQTFVTITEITKPSDSYDSDQKVYAGYMMFDASLFEQFRLVTGVRYEYSNQNLASQTITGEGVDVHTFYRDWLPSVNLTYLFDQQINFRLAYSTTLARPEFREIAPFTYFDFVTNELVKGNPGLKRSLINNYDLRFELFPNPGELLAVSVFYKKFQNPIEQILTASSGNEPTRSYTNAIDATNYGVEIEVRKNLNFISHIFQNMSFVGNLTLIKSRIKVENTGSNNFQDNDRPLQGQADYVFNAGLYYDNLPIGFNASLVYNKVGQRISAVGVNDLGDIIEKPIDLIDFSISKKLFDNFTVKASVKDLLNQDKIFIQQTVSGDRVAELNRSGRVFSLGLSYQL